MSRLRVLGAGVLIAALALGASACSKDEKKAPTSDRAPISFADPPEGSTDLGLCYAYDVEQMKELIGGEGTFKRLAPSAIGTKTDKVRGEACSWERNEPNGDALSMRIEVRNYKDDTATLDSQFKALHDGTIGATDQPNLGDAAFSSVSDSTSLLQIKSGPYLLTLASRANGGLDPVKLDALKLLGASGLEQLP